VFVGHSVVFINDRLHWFGCNDSGECCDRRKRHGGCRQRRDSRRTRQYRCGGKSGESAPHGSARVEGGLMTGNGQIPFLDLITPHLELEEELVWVFRGILETAGFAGGPFVEGFEREFAEF